MASSSSSASATSSSAFLLLGEACIEMLVMKKTIQKMSTLTSKSILIKLLVLHTDIKRLRFSKFNLSPTQPYIMQKKKGGGTLRI